MVFFKFIGDIFFPKVCLGCAGLGSYICDDCGKKLQPVKDDICLYCERKSYLGLTHPFCKKTYGIDGFLAFYQYNDFLKKIIKQIKYRLAQDVFYDFRLKIHSEVQEKILFYKHLYSGGVLQPVPLHKSKLNSRGFNQSFLIADFFNFFLNLEIVDWFERKKETLPQAEIKTKKDRYLNIKGAFYPKEKIKPKSKMIIIDDVVTSGFTVKELAKTAKKAGVSKVYVIALARG